MKKISFIAIICLFLFTVVAQISKKININYDQKFNLKKVNNLYEGQQIQAISFTGKDIISYSEKTGKPNMPLMSINVSVPNGAVFLDANIIKNKSILHENILLEAVQRIIPVSYAGEVDYINPNYTSFDQNIYPKENVKFTGISKLSSYTIFNFQVSPFNYNIATMNLEEIQDFTLEFTYDIGKDISNVRKWDDGNFHKIVTNIVVNKDEVPFPESRIKTKEDVQHLIITDRALKNSFQVLADHRIANGLISEVIEVATIYSNYEGATNQIKIKNCVKDYYENKGLKWIVMGGDDYIVPDQNVYGIVNDDPDYADSTIPADLFYTCFDNQFDWNATNDDKVGNTDDNVDMSPEVFIGRIPVRTAEQAIAYITKMIDYEENPPVEIADKFLMTGCELWGYVGSVSDGEAKSEGMWNDYIADNWAGTKYRFYDTNTDFSGGDSYDLTASNLQDQIDYGYGFVHMATHGNQTMWSTESGSNYSSNSALGQTNVKSGIVATIACITNAFDCDADATSANCSGGPYMADPSLSEGFLRNPDGGAVGYLGSSRYGWGSGDIAAHGISFQYNDQFFYKLFTGEGQTEETSKRFGAVVTLAKMDYIGSSAENGAYRWIMYALNVAGDPALKIITGNALISCRFTSPKDNSSFESGSIITIAANAVDLQDKSVEKVSFYLDDNLLFEDTREPYSYNWDTSGFESKTYTIKSVVTDNDGNLAEDEITVGLTNYIEVDDFETGDFTENPWVYSGNSNWIIDSNNAYEGEYSSKSGVIGDNEYSRMSFTVDFIEDGAVSFYRKVSSEDNYDYLRFFVDGTEKGKWSGAITWGEVNYTVTSGTHELSWEYRKDEYVLEGSDCAWVDNILLSGIESGIEDGLSNLPLENKLYQNYPNPFNPMTEINFYITNENEVKLSVFNSSGQLVSELVNEVVNAGMHSISFDGNKLNSGIYFYILEVDNNKFNNKMLLIK